MSMERLRVAVGDASALFGRGVRDALRTLDTRIEVVGQAGSPEELVRLVNTEHPELAVAGFEPPEVSIGLSRVLDPVPVLVLTWSRRPEDLWRAVKTGVAGLLDKELPAEDLVRAVWAVADGFSAFRDARHHELARRIAGGLPVDLRGVRSGTGLTTRQREIVRLVAQGYSNKEVATHLGIAQQTAKNHLHQLMAKLGLTSRVQLCAWALTNPDEVGGDAEPLADAEPAV